MGRVLFIGGPGLISRSAIGALAGEGWEVALLTRPKELDLANVAVFFGDRNDRRDLEVAREFAPDVVVDTICFDADQAKAAAEVFAGVDHYVFMSTVDVYGYPYPELPVKESTPRGVAISPYAAAKQQAEDAFLAAHSERGFPVTLGRVGYSLGHRFMLSPFSRDGRGFVRRLRQGKPVVTPGDGTTTLQPACAVDTGRKIAAIAGLAGAIGGPLNLAGPRPMTHDEYVRAIGSVVGVEPEIVHISTDVLLQVDDPAIQDDLLPELTRYPHFVSNDAFDRLVPDFELSTPLEDGIRSYIDRQDALDRFANAPEPPDEHLLNRWAAATEAFTHYRPAAG